MLEIKYNNPLQNKENINLKNTNLNLTKIQGTLTSQIQLRDEKSQEPFYYSLLVFFLISTQETPTYRF